MPKKDGSPTKREAQLAAAPRLSMWDLIRAPTPSYRFEIPKAASHPGICGVCQGLIEPGQIIYHVEIAGRGRQPGTTWGLARHEGCDLRDDDGVYAAVIRDAWDTAVARCVPRPRRRPEVFCDPAIDDLDGFLPARP